MIKVMIFGTFDLIHPGHLHMLKEAKEYGDYLIVIVARDNTVCEVKGRPPKFNENERLSNIQQLNIANKVQLGCIGDKYEIIVQEQPDIIALGYDQKEFVDKLVDVISDNTRIVRLSPYMPEIYKSSKMKLD